MPKIQSINEKQVSVQLSNPGFRNNIGKSEKANHNQPTKTVITIVKHKAGNSTWFSWRDMEGWIYNYHRQYETNVFAPI